MTAEAHEREAAYAELRKVLAHLRAVRDPWIRRDLARKRRELLDRLARP